MIKTARFCLSLFDSDASISCVVSPIGSTEVAWRVCFYKIINFSSEANKQLITEVTITTMQQSF